jgi:hypothetical protein
MVRSGELYIIINLGGIFTHSSSAKYALAIVNCLIDVIDKGIGCTYDI